MAHILGCEVVRPLLLDLFCCAGGAATGYHRAGFEVVGVDIEPHPNYPFDFVLADALAFTRDIVAAKALYGNVAFEAVHASPPCQAFSIATLHHGAAQASKHPDLVDPVRQLLRNLGLPSVIENVAGAPIRHDLTLCGEMFGLRVHRHRYFELDGWFAMQPRHAPHNLGGARDNCHIEEGYARQVVGNYANHADAADAMGINWMNHRELAESIPPAYTKFIGEQLMTHVLADRAAAQSGNLR